MHQQDVLEFDEVTVEDLTAVNEAASIGSVGSIGTLSTPAGTIGSIGTFGSR